MTARAHLGTHLLAPPAARITPAVARRWLQCTYPALASFAALGYYPAALSTVARKRDKIDEIRLALASLARDVRCVTAACGQVLATGRALPAAVDPDHTYGSRRAARDYARLRASRDPADRKIARDHRRHYL